MTEKFGQSLVGVERRMGEQLSPNGKFINYKPGQRKYEKRFLHKKWRKWAKKDPEMVPNKIRFKGWAD